MNRSGSIARDRSFESVINKIMRLRTENQERLKSAMYNLLVVCSVVTFLTVCIILRPFFRPLLWAFLSGAVLYPFKRKVSQLLNGWFARLEERDSNVFLAICIGPLEATNYFGSLLWSWLLEHWQLLAAGLGITSCIKLLLVYAPKDFLCALWRCIMYSHTLFVNLIGFLNIYVLITIIAVYLATVYVFWRVENSSKFVIAGQSLWIAIIGYCCSFLGALQVPAFLLIMSFGAVSIVYHLQRTEDESNFVQKLKKLLNKQDFEKSISNIKLQKLSLTSDMEDIDISLSEATDTIADEEAEAKAADEKLEPKLSSFYFKCLLFTCGATILFRHVWVMILAAIPLSVHLTIRFGQITGITGFICNKINDVYLAAKNWAIEHHSAVLPLCLPGMLKLTHRINAIIRNSCKSSIDVVTSIILIIIMLLIIGFLSVFFCVNISSETIEVAYLTKDLINKTITERPELVNILPANMQASIDDALDNAHDYGRRKIETYINDWLVEADQLHATKLKHQILDVWDRLIQYWMDMNKSSDSSYGPRVPTEAIKSTIGEIVDNPGHFKELVLVAKQGILGWAKSNTQTILEVADSLWHIIRTNISVIMAFTGEILSLLFLGGQACIQFILDMIIYFTALFYFLSCSDEKYAPLHMTKYIGFFPYGAKISDALEHSISNVLISMFKCSVFTGLFTWLMHTVFGARIVFLPSALASIFAAAPFLGSYWCALPAFLELWLAQDRFYAGISLLLLQFFVPPYFEAAIYTEMKGGGHPYLTGLAIAGGMYWIGWQGAMLGPLMLCFFISIFDVVALRSSDEQRRSSDEDTRST